MGPEMTVDELKAKLDAKERFTLLDVREEHELAIASIPGAKVTHIPLGELQGRLGELDKDAEIAVLCRSGGRSAHATHHLRQLGYKATNVAGGILAWSARIDPSVPQY
jgi:sulfur-carrier protein adenylyltransferase/sulfurtransferase